MFFLYATPMACSVGLYTTLKTDEFIIHKVSVLKAVMKKSDENLYLG